MRLNNTQLELDDNYINEEFICDCLITQERKKVWAVELDLLTEFFRVCKENDIKACAFAGTLLGAVRHKGFIPWDDDADVCMTRDNYEKLLRIGKEKFRHPYFLQTAQNDSEFWTCCARLRNSETTGIISWNYSSNYNNGIFIDVFAVDGVPGNELLACIQKKQLRILRKILKVYKSPLDAEKRSALSKALIRLARKTFFRIADYDKLDDLYHRISSFYNGKTEIVDLISVGGKYSCYERDLLETVEMPFESIVIPIPQNSDRVLQMIYGNYMDFPPMEERGQDHKDKIIFDADIPYKTYIKMNENTKIQWDPKNKTVRLLE